MDGTVTIATSADTAAGAAAGAVGQSSTAGSAITARLADADDAAACDERGCQCVPGLTPPADRLVALHDLIAAETQPLVIVTQLLRLCRDEHATLWEHHADPRCRARVARLIGRVGEALPPPGFESTVSEPARRALSAALHDHDDIPPVVIAHALAELLDARYGDSFTDWFRARSPYQPAVGDPVPLDSPDLPAITDMAPTAPPWRLANRLDETRRVRLAGAWATQFRVVFDYSAFDALAGVVDRDTVIATCHPNRDLTELDLPADRHAPAFPVGPADTGAQRERIRHLLDKAVDVGATVAVLPELAVTEALADELAAWVRAPGPLRLLVAGSFHHTDHGDPARRANRAVAWVRGHPAPLLHDKHSPADRPVAEDISPDGWPELRVHVTADGWHIVIAVCRDLLNPQAVHALTEAGANLVFAPSMSETLVAFGGPVAQLVGTCQAIVAVANNPAEWSDPDRPGERREPARAVFGHPGFAQQSRQVHAPDPAPGIATLRVHDGRLGWHRIDGAVATSAGDITAAGTPPPWMSTLADGRASRARPGDRVTLRPAAVLVALTGPPTTPRVLLTTRAADLTHYAGQLVFPGGAADDGDGDPIATALREAAEEIGLDAGSVHVVGTLPSFALVDSGFVVTPVLAWTVAPRFLRSPNPAEVATVHWAPVATTAERLRGDGARLGVMTAAILDIVRAHLPGG